MRRAASGGSTAGIVLVHGSYHGAWCWERLLPLLRTPAVAVDLGGAGGTEGAPSLGDFRDTIERAVLESGWDRVVLVGHSMAGLTVPAVAARIPSRIAQLVLISGIVPPEGRALIDTLPWVSRCYLRLALRRGAAAAPLSPRVARSLFCDDLDAATAARVLERLRPEPLRLFFEPVSRLGLPADLPTTYVTLRRDRAVSPAQQRAAACRLPNASLEEVDAGHDVMISRPAALAAILERLANQEGAVL
jgi:pimeloyl-ACP methyl ester carboxylesterase